jgi:hypothetical protein
MELRARKRLKLGREMCYNPCTAFEGAMGAMIEGAMNRALLAITMGDPAGVGPEIVLKALRHTHVYRRCRPLVLGDRRILERAAPWVGSPGLDFDVVDAPAAGRYTPGVITARRLPDRPGERRRRPRRRRVRLPGV